MVRIAALGNFITSDENRPIDDVTSLDAQRKRSQTYRYVTILDMQVDSDKDTVDPGYGLSLTILTEHGVRDGAGGTQASTPRHVIEKVFDILGIFPTGLGIIPTEK